jgi:carboxypeptidase Taq
VGGAEKRAEAMSVLASMAHEMATAPHIADWIDKAENEDLDAAQKAAVAEFRRSYINRTCLSSDFVARQVRRARRGTRVLLD